LLRDSFVMRLDDRVLIALPSDALFEAGRAGSFLVGKLGAKYDFAGVLFLGILKALSMMTFLKWKPYNRFQKDRDYFCSELCYEAFAAAGLDIVPEVNEAAITSPADIASSSRMEKVPFLTHGD